MPNTERIAPEIDFQDSFSLYMKYDKGSIIIGTEDIKVEAIPTFVYIIAKKLNVIPR